MSVKGFQFGNTIHKYDYDELDNKPSFDKTYENLTAGNAEQLMTDKGITDKVPYLLRASGGNGADREEDKIVGGTVAWNQLCNDTSVTVPINHKYYMIKSGTTLIGVSDGSPITGLTSGTDIVTDLTQMFGSSIADRAYAMNQATAGSGINWLKSMGFFTADYYPYDAGTLKSVEGLTAHSMVGFNQWTNDNYEIDTNANIFINEDGTISVGMKTYQENSNRYPVPKINAAQWAFEIDYKVVSTTDSRTWFKVVFFYTDGSTSNIEAFPVPSAGYTAHAVRVSDFGKTVDHVAIGSWAYSGNVVLSNLCLHLVGDGSRNGEYEHYVKHSYPLDSTLTLRGIPKLDSNNQLYYDGDEYASDGTVTRRYGIVDLGTLSWGKSNTAFLTTTLNGIINPPSTTATYPAVLLSKGNYVLKSSNADSGVSGTYEFVVTASGQIIYRYPQDGIADGTAFANLMSGTYMIYPLKTTTTEEADPYQNPQILDPYGTEAYETTGIVPVGHETFYPENLRKKIEDAPDSPTTDGDYVLKRTNGVNTYATAPGMDVVTVSGTTVTQTGVANKFYVCGTLATLTFTAPSSGICGIRFTSGSTPTVLTVSGVSYWMNGFDPTSLEASKTYEISILNGVGVVGC